MGGFYGDSLLKPEKLSSACRRSASSNNLQTVSVLRLEKEDESQRLPGYNSTLKILPGFRGVFFRPFKKSIFLAMAWGLPEMEKKRIVVRCLTDNAVDH